LLKLDRGTLLIAVASPGWAQELAMHEPVLLERLRGRGVEVDKMRFRVGDVAPPDRGGVVAPAKETVEAAIRESEHDPIALPHEKLADPALRDIVAKTGRSVARANAIERVRAKAASERKPRIPGSK
jgi:hypothetical protein